MTIRRIHLAAALLGAALPLRVQAEELDLARAMARARAQAREVTAALARRQASAQRVRQAEAYRLPKVTVQQIWMRTDSPADAFGSLLNQERFSLEEFAAGDPNDPGAIETSLLRFEVSLPIYSGGELSVRVRQARLAAEAARASAGWAEESAALAGAEAFIRLAQAREQVALLEGSLAAVHAHVASARAYVDQGMLVRSELLRAEVEQSRIEDLLSQARGQATVAEANLSFRLAMDLDATWQLAPLPHPPPLTEGLDGWLAGAGARRDLAAHRRLLEAGELEAKVQRSGLLPKVGIVARHDRNDERLFGSSGDSTAVMAVATLDLWAGGRHRAGAAAARFEAAAARSEIEQLGEAIRLAVASAYQQAVTSRERHRTALAAQEAAREAERIVRERFDKGVVRTIDLLDAATARREAESRELVARAEAYLASFALALEAGRPPESVLPTGGVSAASSPAGVDPLGERRPIPSRPGSLPPGADPMRTDR